MMIELKKRLIECLRAYFSKNKLVVFMKVSVETRLTQIELTTCGAFIAFATDW